MSRFTNKIVVITAGSSGIGLAAAQEFEREGAKVVVTGRNMDTLASAVKALSKDAVVVKADVTNAADLDQLFATVRKKHGHIDVLFANAGVANLSPLETVLSTAAHKPRSSARRGPQHRGR